MIYCQAVCLLISCTTTTLNGSLFSQCLTLSLPRMLLHWRLTTVLSTMILSGSPLASGSSQINTWHVTNYLSEILGFSSSLFSSPSKILPDHVLEDGTYFLTEGGLPEWKELYSFIKHEDTHPPSTGP